MQSLQCGAQNYAWGKKASASMVAKLNHVPTPTSAEEEAKRYAELWIGVHTSMPSKVVSSSDSSSTVLLKDFLATNADRYLGAEHLKFYNNRPELPFLLKVLSIDKALSIQAHPNRTLAQKLFSRDPKNYPDPNHKPELIVALTSPFEALCCFRTVSQMLYFIRQSPFLAEVVGSKAVAALEAAAKNEVAGEATKEDAKAAIRLALEHVYGCDAAKMEAALKGHAQLITEKRLAAVTDAAATPDAVHAVFMRTAIDFPGDVGLWMMYFLNYLQLEKGDALFLAANEPHAYLSGEGVEIMANSDNVVRAGLTPKFKDVETLLNMLTYDTNALANSKYTASPSESVQEYAPPSWCDDFSLFAVRLNRSKGVTTATVTPPSVGLGICVASSAGKGAVLTSEGGVGDDEGSDEASRTCVFGKKFVVPAGKKVTFTLKEGEDDCLIFIGATNVHGATRKSNL